MVVIRADLIGLCPGVRRALRLAEQAIVENPGVPLYSFGPLIHNRRAVDGLKQRGLMPVEDLSHVREGIVVIRSHGIGPAERSECEKPGIRCIDATCPTVRRIQEDVRAYSARGFDVLIVGDPRHGEGSRRLCTSRRLHGAALASGRPSWHVEAAADLPEGIGDFARVGISAGASTPDVVIDEVEAALLALVPKGR